MSHLNPTARIRLSRSAIEDLRALTDSRAAPVWRERAGWVHALNGDHAPFMRDPRGTTVRYEQLRPFHPGRRARDLDVIDAEKCGTLLRSVGFCRLATRPGILSRWEQAGSAMWLGPLEDDEGWRTTVQEISLAGIDLDVAELTRRLDEAALTDAELAAGPAAWETVGPTPPVAGNDRGSGRRGHLTEQLLHVGADLIADGAHTVEFEPAERTCTRPFARWRVSAAAICERPEFCTHT